MGFWQRFVTWLFSPARRKSPADDGPIEVDEAAITDELELLKEARRLGEAGQPAADATLSPGIEAQIAHRIDKARMSHVEWATTRLAVLNGDLARLDATTFVDSALQADQEFARKADTLLNEHIPLLRKLSADMRAGKETLEVFRHRNGLTRNARYPKGWSKILRYVGLVTLVLIEAFVNAMFFATGLDTGLVGGFVYAAILASLNVGVAFLLGRHFVPNLFHRQVIRKAAGGLFLLIAGLAMVTISFTIAHYRDALGADADSAAKAALVAIKQAPFSLEDINSIVLCGVSFIFAAAALVDGVLLDDSYPGYGRHDREYVQAESEYRQEIEGLHEKLEELKEERLEQLEADTKNAKALLMRQEDLLENKEKTRVRLEAAMTNAQRCMDSLVMQFRTENAMYRKGRPDPAYFSVMPTLPDLPLPDFKIEAGRASLALQQERLQELHARLQSVRAAIQSGFTQKFNALVSLEEQLVPVDTVSPTPFTAVTA